MGDVLASEELIDEPSDYGSLRPGTRLGRYELLVPIARGGMARVWAARLHGQRGFQKLVAIKTILPHLANEAEFERMFLDEARIASGVHHPNVCEIYELGEERRVLYLAMEWVSGDSLARVLRASGTTEPLDPRVVARVLADACAGLHAAHELTDDDGRQLGVVHRDLSPHNILLTADGVAKVADFGVAKALGQLHEATSAGQLKGKIAYMAPEQVTGGAIDRRSDVFSLGCVLYEATTGVRPFRGDGDHQVMHAVLKGEFAAPSSVIRGYPQELERIVQRALSPQPILRFPTAERMRFALEEFLARGQLVTQSNVAQVVRARIGEGIERRKERIRQASTAGDREQWQDPHGGMTPSNQARDGRSGVQPSLGRPLYSTMQMTRPEGTAPPAPGAVASPSAPPPPLAPPPSMPPQVGSATVPQAPPVAQPHYTPSPVSQHGPAAAPMAMPPPPVPPALGQTLAMPPIASPNVAERSSPGYPAAPPAAPPAFGPGPSLPPSSGAPPFGYAPASHGGPPGAAPPPFGPQDLGPPPEVRASQPPAGAGQYLLAAGVGLLLAAVIGGGGWYAWRARRAALEPAPILDPPAAASAAPTQPGASTEIVFAVTPAEGVTLTVDGRELPVGERSVPRPPAGSTVTVVARAPGYEPKTVLVDYFSKSPLELTLEPEALSLDDVPPTPASPAPDPAGADPAKGGDAPKGDGPKPDKPKPAPKGDPGLPANPY